MSFSTSLTYLSKLSASPPFLDGWILIVYNNVMQNNGVIKNPKRQEPSVGGLLRQKQKDSLRLSLLDTASRMVAEGGTESLSLRKLAEEVGASTMVVYTAFGSKEGLLDELWKEGFRRLWEIEEGALKESDPLKRLRALGDAYRRNALSNPSFYKLVFGGRLPLSNLSQEMEKEQSRQTFMVLVQTISDCQKAGLLSSKLLDVEIAAMFWSTAHGAISLELSGMLSQWAEPDQIYSLNFDNLLRGLR